MIPCHPPRQPGTSGTVCSALAHALMMKSLTDSFTPRPSSLLVQLARKAIKRVEPDFAAQVEMRMVCLASVRRAPTVSAHAVEPTSLISRPSYILSTCAAARPVGHRDGGRGRGVGLGSAGADGAAGAVVAPSTSALTIRPCGPEPLNPGKARPLSAAIRRRAARLRCGLPSAACGAARGGGRCGGRRRGGRGLCLGFGRFGGAAPVPMSPALSPSSRRTAMEA